MSSGEKKAVAIIALVAIVVVAVVGSAVGVLVATAHSDDEDGAYLHLAVGDQLHTVEPVRWCDVFLTECTPPPNQPQRETPHVPVPTGTSVLLSVPSVIASGPWSLTALYATPKGLYEDSRILQSGTTFTVKLESEPDRVLVGITVIVPSAVVNADGTIDTARGALAVQTAPVGFAVPAI
ncbi:MULTISPECIES: DUF2771 family protein [Gordonia]|nr:MULTISPECIES: DUF2771 family protein [Gordonia]WLP89558.1 DUF2771 family protein [Gordonia sp. NB41Y]